MTTREPTVAESGRQRRLDELFEDEPFLSPTMKARLLHDRAAIDAEPEGESHPGPATNPPLLTITPDNSEEEAARFWMQRIESPRGARPTDLELVGEASKGELLPTPGMLKRAESFAALNDAHPADSGGVPGLNSSGKAGARGPAPGRPAPAWRDASTRKAEPAEPAQPRSKNKRSAPPEEASHPPRAVSPPELLGESTETAVERQMEMRPEPAKRVPLAEAAAFLRSECGAGKPPRGLEALERFGRDVARRWLSEVPPRDVGRLD